MKEKKHIKWLNGFARLLCALITTEVKIQMDSPLKFYRLPRDKNVQLEYSKIFHTKSINWTQGHICVAHWSINRENSADLPDIIIPENQYEIICEKCTKAKRTFELYKSPSNKLRNQLKNAKRKYEVATKIMATTPKTSRNLVKRDIAVYFEEKRIFKETI